jgi:DnaJ-class molecular chaperone
VKTKTCPDCNGDGVIGKGTDDEQQCPTCGGSGFVPDDDNDEEVTRTKNCRPSGSWARARLLPGAN